MKCKPACNVGCGSSIQNTQIHTPMIRERIVVVKQLISCRVSARRGSQGKHAEGVRRQVDHARVSVLELVLVVGQRNMQRLRWQPDWVGAQVPRHLSPLPENSKRQTDSQSDSQTDRQTDHKQTQRQRDRRRECSVCGQIVTYANALSDGSTQCMRCKNQERPTSLLNTYR